MYSSDKISDSLSKVSELETAAAELEKQNRHLLKHIHKTHAQSARNLIHYLAVRAHDLTSLQEALSDMAISSIGHSESCMLNNLQKVHYLLSALAQSPVQHGAFDELNGAESAKILKHNSESLLGKASFRGQSKIMVTLPTEAAEQYKLVSDMVAAGMHIARINTAHDDKDAWKNMIANVQKAAEAHKKKVKIYMDIEGPKMRTELCSNTGDEGKDHLLLRRGDTVRLQKDKAAPGSRNTLTLSIPEVFACVKNGESVWFDDGKIGGFIKSSNGEGFEVRITNAPEDGFKLKSEKGVNFPDSELHLPALTHDDLEHLHFIARHADMVGYSFVQTEKDVRQLQHHLEKLGRKDIGIILKIETSLGFRNLPALLFAAMRSKQCGVMIARGDLAVEIGYSRMAEVQEEIMWLAEAAHLPVIWATQVLETQVKTGTATRAEISDVVKSVRAECVMLNKGPHIIDAIHTLIDIDKRMAAHEDKKRKILRSLRVARDFITAMNTITPETTKK